MFTGLDQHYWYTQNSGKHIHVYFYDNQYWIKLERKNVYLYTKALASTTINKMHVSESSARKKKHTFFIGLN